MKKEIPCHLVAGFLGSGKTTFIKQLLTYKPSDEKWAVLGSVDLSCAFLQQFVGALYKAEPATCSYST
jgi:ATP/maltotriose-dependent transcriptional regulator MalT